MNVSIGDTKSNLPLVTIGVLSYNYAKYIIAALDSIISQTYKNIELIIVDDCSTDESQQLIEDWIKCHAATCTYLKNKTNKGITNTSNKIVQLAKGKYITLFATDDIMLPERIEKQVAVLEAVGDEYGMCYTHCQFMDEQGVIISNEVFKDKYIIHEGSVLKEYTSRTFGFVTPTTLIRTAVYQTTGLYNENILIEDYDFFLRLIACFKVAYCAYPGIIYRLKKESSAIFKKVRDNNHERYFCDRIQSNVNALKFINQSEVKSILNNKINQHLKSLAIHNSKFFYKMLFFVFRNGFFKVKPRIILIKVKHLLTK
jgi:glycosyltransferase involved in cell wall biosynthesis